jgi:hypothetical protein
MTYRIDDRGVEILSDPSPGAFARACVKRWSQVAKFAT